MITFDEIEAQEVFVNQLFEKAIESDSDNDWMLWNTEFNNLATMIKTFGRNYRRIKKIKILLQ